MAGENGICYIVGAGSFVKPFSPGACDFIIAADGGYDRLCALGIPCDLLIGDLDSISELPAGTEVIKHPVRKNETDAHLAYLEGARRGYTKFRLLGGTGGREDHTQANLALALYASRRGHSLDLIGEGCRYTVITNDAVTLSSNEGDHLSILAFGSDAEGVSIAGAEYELSEATLLTEFPLGVSNSFKGQTVKVEVKQGSLLIIITENEKQY